MKLPWFLTREPDASLPSHVKGIKQGNQPGNYEQQAGHTPDGRSTAARATGVNPQDREPIDPRMPTLTPP